MKMIVAVGLDDDTVSSSLTCSCPCVAWSSECA